ncbi:MAG: hypothetical protein ACYC7L_06105, partial [Nitrospirota bacterium]
PFLRTGYRNTGPIVGKELFNFKYCGRAFSIRPGIAGGLAQYLQIKIYIKWQEYFSQSAQRSQRNVQNVGVI